MSPTPGQIKIDNVHYYEPNWTRAEKLDIWFYNYVKYPLRRLFSLRVNFYFTWDDES